MAADDPTGSRTRRSQAERRRESERKLLDAAAAVVAERGSAKASFAEIAAAAGQSPSNPHYLFGSKANLLEALVAEFADRYSDEVVGSIADATGLDAIVRVVTMFVRSLRRPLTMTKAFYVLLGESLSTAPDLRPGLNEYHRWLQGLVAGWITQGIDEGDIRSDLDVDAAAAHIVGTVRGIGFLVLNDPDAYDLGALEAETVEALERQLRPADLTR
jgi:AcrR family transcriptional regulator